MSEQHDPFSPRRVDEVVEQLTTTGQTDLSQPSERLVHDMQRLYGLEQKQYMRALQRVEDRLVAFYIPSDEQLTRSLRRQESQRTHVRKKTEGNFTLMEQRYPAKSSWSGSGRKISLLVALLVLTVLVGSLLVVLNVAHQQTGLGHGPGVVPGVAPSPTSPAAVFGKTVYTTPASSGGFYELSWSPDGKRVASDNGDIQMWDASTGKHLVTVAFSAGVYPVTLAWSPDSQLVAIGTSTGIELVNGDTGSLVRSYAVGAIARSTTRDGGGYLAAHLLTSGGQGIRALAWSPDGKYLAVSTSLGATSLLQVINAQSGAVAYSLPVTGNYLATTISWSFDGRYIAANVYNAGPGSQTVSLDQMVLVQVWKVSTRQIVLQQPGGNSGVADTLAWQPQSDNLAFQSWKPESGGGRTSMLVIWNVESKKETLQYKADMYGSLAWSPDGKYLAYVGALASVNNNAASVWVSIIDPVSGQQIYVYKRHHKQIAALAWSPDGKYIVSGEGTTTGDMVAQVWTAGE